MPAPYHSVFYRPFFAAKPTASKHWRQQELVLEPCVACAAGTRFRYPSSFVLVPGELDAELTRLHASLFQYQSADVDTGSSARTTNAVDNALSKLASTLRLDCSVGNRQAARRAVGKTWQDGMLSSGLFVHGYSLAMVLCINAFRKKTGSSVMFWIAFNKCGLSLLCRWYLRSYQSCTWSRLSSKF